MSPCAHGAGADQDQRQHGREAAEQEERAEEDEVRGINTKAQLAEAEAAMQRRLRQAAMEAGATLVAPETVFLSADTKLGRDVVVEPFVVFGPGVTVEDDAVIRSFSHLERAHVGRRAQVGPYARLRPGARLQEDVHIGNFVEVKEAVIEAGAKANHLSYIGDATVGAGANVGAGTITCNYDGFDKHRTDIGAQAFIGSNSALVAPVKIGDGAYAGSGSVLTGDVPAEALAPLRSPSYELAEILDSMPAGEYGDDLPQTGIVPADWHLKRLIGQLRLGPEQQCLDLRSHETLAALHVLMASDLRRLEIAELDMAAVQSHDYRVTQAVAQPATARATAHHRVQIMKSPSEVADTRPSRGAHASQFREERAEPGCGRAA